MKFNEIIDRTGEYLKFVENNPFAFISLLDHLAKQDDYIFLLNLLAAVRSGAEEIRGLVRIPLKM